MNDDLHDEYLHTIEKMLSLGKLRISEIYPVVRLIRPHFYDIALKTSSLISKERFLEDMEMLHCDIIGFEKQWSTYFADIEIPMNKRRELMDIFDRYLRRNRFKGDSDVELFKTKNSGLCLR